jgi:aryl-alcohol dehydrogenase-like predicted oxidoreductase
MIRRRSGKLMDKLSNGKKPLMDFKQQVTFGRTGLKVSQVTATCWHKLLKPKLMPPGEHPPAPADCYRFVLSHPDVNVCMTAPSTAAQMEENLKALDAGPLDTEEMARIRRIGKHIYQKSF